MPEVILSFLFLFVFYNQNRYLGPDIDGARDGHEKKINIGQRSLAAETVTHICAIDSEL